MRVLIIGYGSIGKRHQDVLSTFKSISKIDIVTKQVLLNKGTFKNLLEVKDLDIYDYFVIASETNKHFEQLNFLEKNVTNKLIFCEKPLFSTKKEIEIKQNKVFIGYVLRFHPLLKKLKEKLRGVKIISAYAKCGQYLPYWRTNIDYRKSYSANKEKGGGVLLDLSHEIDYVQWLCGKLNEIKSYQVKTSDLDINSDDLTMIIGKTKKNVFVNISIDYISKNTNRKITIETNENTYELDFISNKLVITNKNGLEEIYNNSNLERNLMFKNMHLDVFSNQKTICNFNQAMDVMNSISAIQNENK